MARRNPRNIRKFGIAEWYGRPFHVLPRYDREQLASLYNEPESARPDCPFQSTEVRRVRCGKRGGICSVREYERDHGGAVNLFPGPQAIHTVCPARFKARGLVQSWAAEIVLDTPMPLVIDEVPFLERRDSAGTRAVGKIDSILVSPDRSAFNWCALEMQAVYLSGSKTGRAMSQAIGGDAGLAFISTLGRPDYRSSSVKRLMPQLQIKVPTLRRWGKKTVVVVDECFFARLGEMTRENDISNADIAWLVVGFEECASKIEIVKKAVHFTKLEESVIGLTAGNPPSQRVFEDRIRQRVTERYPTNGAN